MRSKKKQALQEDETKTNGESNDGAWNHAVDAIDEKTSMEGMAITFQDTKITASASEASSDVGYTPQHLDIEKSDSEQDSGCQSSCARISIGARVAKQIARNPCFCLWFSLIFAIGLSVVGYFVGNFTVSAELDGWLSRGTPIANQNTQTTLVNRNTVALFSGDVDTWTDLTSYVQGGLTSHDPTQRMRSLVEASQGEFVAASSAFLDLPGCDVAYYENGKFLDHDENLWPVWETLDESISAFDPPVLKDICISEQNTMAILKEEGLCGGCAEGGCLPPISLVSFARVLVGDTDVSMDCGELVEAWTTSLPLVKGHLNKIVSDMRENVHTTEKTIDVSNPLSVVALFVDSDYGINGNEKVRYTSSVFPTYYSGRPVKDVFAIRDRLDRAESSQYIRVSYDTPDEDFGKLITDPLLISDMKLVVASLSVTTLAMLIHTRSVWLTVIGLVQIALSFPLAYFFYSVVLGLEFFPFLNFIGCFVVFAIGADDVFVAVDKWKNARLNAPHASISEIAVVALPSAARAMLLTTSTTAVAFFATAICPVPALKLFAIFSGLLIIFDYVLCLFLVFPALCIFDKWLCCDALWWFGGAGRSPAGSETFIRRCLRLYYMLIHRCRYLWLFVIIGATIGCSLVARKLSLPNTSEVRILRPDHEFEKNYQWRQRLLISELERERGTRVWFMWGVSPADNGDHRNPRESSTIVLDDTFDPSPVHNQLYLRDFCADLLAQDFASEDVVGSVCPMNRFDSWLKEQAVAETQHELYQMHCQNATQLPIPPEYLHPCMIGFAQAEDFSRVLFNDGKVRVIRLPFRQVGVLWDVGQEKLATSWRKLNEFTISRNELVAPPGVNKVYGSSHDFWWYDTNDSITSTAIGSIGIALSAAFIVVLLSTWSFGVTFFAVFSIAFILLSSTTVLVSLGWTLGFLESVCFAILVGISCDFVLHFGHSYCSLPGHVSQHERTAHALITMGPSILAAAVTTIAASIAMLFASINFFQKFGNILLWSLVMGVFGSMFVFLVLVDIFGPTKPGSLCSRRGSSAKERKVSYDCQDSDSGDRSRQSEDLPLPKRAANLKVDVEAGMQAFAHRSKLREGVEMAPPISRPDRTMPKAASY